jgi:UDP-N-acetylglucosamine:LPS N-acetylglucosamine transferase
MSPLVRARVLVVSASMGAGHDGAARELVRRLNADGHEAEMRDFMTSAPLKIGSLVRGSYEFQMRHAAWTYELTYRLFYLLPFLCPPIGRFMAWLTRRRLLRWITDFQADAVVSTYPLTSVVLGQLRKSGRLTIPVVSFITDFGVHPLWVHQGIDLNMAVHPRPAAEAAAKSGRPAVATGPMVSSRFTVPQDRAAARAWLGLQPDDRAVMIVAGSWAVGAVAKTFRAIAASGRFVPVAICGRDEGLQKRLSRVPGGRALGWTDEMPALMAAADALVENAGGLTAMEALSTGLPIISFKPIAGHGKENTSEMEEVGVSRMAKSPRELLELLEVVTQRGPTREAMVNAGKAMFVSDPAEYVLDVASAGAPVLAPVGAFGSPGAGAGAGVAARAETRIKTPSVAVARIAAMVAAVPLLWAGLTTGVGMAAAWGAGVAHPSKTAGAVAYLGVKLNPIELADPAIQRQLVHLHATAVIDQLTAEADPTAVQRLANSDVDIENGGFGHRVDRRGHHINEAPWRRARGDVRASLHLAQITGEPIKLFVPGRRINAFDLVASRSAHSRCVVPNRTLTPADADEALRIVPRHIYLVNGWDATPTQVEALLQELEARFATARLSGAPLVQLR